MINSTYDFITTWDVVHDLGDPVSFLQDIFRSLKEKGTYLMNEIPASSDLNENLNRSYTFGICT